MREQLKLIESLDSVAVDLNNLAASLHNLGKLHDAQQLFIDALKVWTDAVSCKKTTLCTKEQQCKLTHKWQHKLNSRQAYYSSYFTVHGISYSSISTEVRACWAGENFNTPSSYSEAINIKVHDSIDDNCLLSLVLLYNIGLVNMKLKAHKQALKYFNIAVDTLPDELPPESPASIICILIFHNLGLLYFRMDMLNEALTMLTDSLQYGKLILGTENMLVAKTFIEIGNVLLQFGSTNEALLAFNEFKFVHDRILQKAVSAACCLQHEWNCGAKVA